jgi:flagellar basal-body rod protein FlgG
MLEGLISAAAGMAAQQEQLNAISNDLANVNTNGFESERVAFNDVLYNQVDVAGTETTTGSGANAEIIGRSKAQGALKETKNPLDLAIEGPGYFEVTTTGGQTALTRDGALAVDASGTLVTAEGKCRRPRRCPKLTTPTSPRCRSNTPTSRLRTPRHCAPGRTSSRNRCSTSCANR